MNNRIKLIIRSDYFILAWILALAGTLSFIYLGSKSIWLDEAFSVTVARMNWADFWHNVFQYEANQVFYYLLLHFWINLGLSEFVLRSLSIIFALGAVVMIYVLGRRLFGSRTGLTAAFLIAINAYFIAYAQEARAYTLVVLLAALSSYLFIKALEKPGWKVWAAYIIFSVLGVYSHIYLVFLPAVHFVAAFFLPRKEVPWKSLIISMAVAVLVSLPMIFFALTHDIGQINWVSTPGLKELSWVFSQLSGRGGPALTAVYFVLGAIAIIFAARAYLKDKLTARLWRYIFLLLWLFLPIALAFVFSFVKPIFVMRYLIICLPPLVFIVAEGIYRLKLNWLRAVSLVVLAALSVIALNNWYTSDTRKDYNQKDDFRALTNYVVDNAAPGDAIVVYQPMLTLPYDYYVDRLGTPANLPAKVSYLPEPPDQLNLYYLPKGAPGNWALPDPGEEIVRRLSRYQRVWLVLGYDLGEQKKMQSRQIQDYIEEEYRQVDEQDYFDNIRLYRYDMK
jgi:mannosyltransferase